MIACDVPCVARVLSRVAGTHQRIPYKPCQFVTLWLAPLLMIYRAPPLYGTHYWGVSILSTVQLVAYDTGGSHDLSCSCTLTSWMYCNTRWFLGGFPFLSIHNSWFLTDASAAAVELKHFWATSSVALHFALYSNRHVQYNNYCYVHTHPRTHTHTHTYRQTQTHTLSLKPSHITVNSLFMSLNSSRRGPGCNFNCTLSMRDMSGCLRLTLSSHSYTISVIVYWSILEYTSIMQPLLK